MKRKLCVLILLLMLVSILEGCGLDVPRPEVKEGRFHFTATYVLNGEVKTVSDEYICKYDGIGWVFLEFNQYSRVDAASSKVVGHGVSMVFRISNPVVGVHIVDIKEIESIYS